jgi:uncharacterized caspase-like protein
VSVLVPRQRTIGVRLSEAEYAALERFCVEGGARSISDVARKAISSLISNSNRKSAVASSANRNSVQMKELEGQMRQLAAEISLLKTVHAERATDRTVLALERPSTQLGSRQAAIRKRKEKP